MIKQTRKHRHLYPDDVRYIIELANHHPKWPVEKIFEEALKPRLRRSLILPLTPNMAKKLDKAARRYQISPTAVIYEAMDKWLTAERCGT